MVEKAKLDAEYAVIGCLLIDSAITGELLSLTRPEDFTMPETQTIYKAAVKLFTAGRPVDGVTVRGLIGKEYEQFLRECIDVTPSSVGWRTYVAAMQEQTRVYRMRALAETLAAVNTTDEARDLIGKAGEILSDKNRTRVVTMTEALVRFFEEQGKQREFISYGLSRLDQRLYSDYGDFVVLAGRPSAGKTALALQMAAHMGRQARVGFYSLETSTSKLTDRLVANKCVIDFSHIKRRELTDEEMTRAATWKKDISAAQLELVPASGMTVQDILSIALAQRHKVVVIDYLQLIRGKGKDRFEQVTSVSVDLARMARSHGILVLALSQLSRAAKGQKEQPPTLTDLRESGQIEQDADAVLALYLDDPEVPSGERVLRVLKNKEGTLGQFKLDFAGNIQAFHEIMPGTEWMVRKERAARERDEGDNHVSA